MSGELDISCQAHDDVLVMAVRGELDLYTAPGLRARLLGAVEQGHDAIVLDLRGTTFLDSTALGVIIAATKALQPVGGHLVLVNDRASIAKTLAITGLDRLLAVEGRVDHAVARARAG